VGRELANFVEIHKCCVDSSVSRPVEIFRCRGHSLQNIDPHYKSLH
jgi:hypothetical protein